MNGDKAALKDEIQASTQKELTLIHKEISDQVTKAIDARMRGVNFELTKIQMTLTNMEADDWERQHVYVNALQYYMETIPLAESIGYDFVTAKMLANIQQILRRGLDMLPSQTVNLTTTLEKLPSKYATDVESILALLKSSRDAENQRKPQTPPPPPTAKADNEHEK